MSARRSHRIGCFLPLHSDVDFGVATDLARWLASRGSGRFGGRGGGVGVGELFRAGWLVGWLVYICALVRSGAVASQAFKSTYDRASARV